MWRDFGQGGVVFGGVGFSFVFRNFNIWVSGVECGGCNSAIARSFVRHEVRELVRFWGDSSFD